MIGAIFNPPDHIDNYYVARRNLFIHRMATNGAWDTAVTGTGAVTQDAGRILLITGTTDNSTAIAYDVPHGCAPGGVSGRLDFRNRFIWTFSFTASGGSNANFRRYIQLKEANTAGDLGAIGLGLKLANLTLTGESYATARSDVALMTISASSTYYTVTIDHFPGVKVDFYINGTLKGSITTAANVPNALTSADCYMFLATANGAHDPDVSATLALAGPEIAMRYASI